MAGKFSLDIFKFLDALGERGDAYAALSVEEKGGFAPLVVQRWLAGTKEARQVVALNTFANKHIFTLAKHPHLLSLVFQACTGRQRRRYFWLGIKNSGKTPCRDAVLQQYYGWSSNELRRQLVLPSKDKIVSLAEHLGWQKDEMVKLKKELS